MITQEKMDDIFISTLESIIQVCSLITSGNVAHYIPSIKGHCQEMIGFYKDNPISSWHSIVDIDLPPTNKNCLFYYQGNVYIGFVRGDLSLFLYNNLDLHLYIHDIDYWMKIPELPKE